MGSAKTRGSARAGEKEKIFPRDFSKQERRFIGHYLRNGFREYEALKKSGYKLSGKEQGDRRKAALLLRKPHIAKVVSRAINETVMSATEAEARLARIARGSLEDFLTFDRSTGRYDIDLGKASELGQLGLIRKIHRFKDGRIQVELYNAAEALHDILKMAGRFQPAPTEAAQGLVDLLSRAVAK